MKTFKKKPVLIEAEQWLGTEKQTKKLLSDSVIMLSASRDGSVLVPTLGGNLMCNLSDYIVTDKDGGRSVVDAETFDSTYDLVEAVSDSTTAEEAFGEKVKVKKVKKQSTKAVTGVEAEAGAEVK